MLAYNEAINRPRQKDYRNKMTDNLFQDDNKFDPELEMDNDPKKDFLGELVGEGKKFKDAQALARGKYEADRTVDMLKFRMDELRSDYQKLHEEKTNGAKLAELLERLEKGPAQKQTDGVITPNAENVNEPKINPEDIKKDVLAEIRRDEEEKRAKANFDMVQKRLQERFGNNFQKVLNEQRESLELTVEDINNLARKSPEAFFRAVGLDQEKKSDFQAPPRSDHRSDSFSPRNEKRTWSWYQELKKTDPNLYRSSKITNQMMKDYETLGPDFEDGDFTRFGNIR